MRKAPWYPRASGFGVDIEHLPAPSHFVMVSGQLRPFLVKLIVTFVANIICTGEFIWLMGAILPHDLLGGHTGGGYVSQLDKPHGFSCCSITRGLASLPGHCYSVGTEQPTAMDSALGWCLSLSEGVGCSLRPPAFPVRASPTPPRVPV